MNVWTLKIDSLGVVSRLKTNRNLQHSQTASILKWINRVCTFSYSTYILPVITFVQIGIPIKTCVGPFRVTITNYNTYIKFWFTWSHYSRSLFSLFKYSNKIKVLSVGINCLEYCNFHKAYPIEKPKQTISRFKFFLYCWV